MFVGVLIVLVAAFGSTNQWEWGGQERSYPVAFRDLNSVDRERYPEQVKEPYRWLENQTLSATQQFITAQNELFRAYVDHGNVLSRMTTTVTERWNSPSYSCPTRINGKYYYSFNSGLMKQPVFKEANSLDADETDTTTVLDPNQWSAEGHISISSKVFSEDGQYLTYTISHRGSDFQTIKVMKLSNYEVLDDEIPRVKMPYVTWTPDNDGFFYSKFANTGENADGSDTSQDKNHSIYYHKLSTPATEDRLIFSRPDVAQSYVFCQSADNGNRIIVMVYKGSTDKTDISVVDTNVFKTGDQNMEMTTLVGNFEDGAKYLDHIGPVYYFMTDRDAPRYKIIKVNASSNSLTQETVVPEDDTRTLGDAALYQNKLVLVYLRDVKHELEIYDLGIGTTQKITTGVVAVGCLADDKDHHEMFFSEETFFKPRTIYRYSFTSNERTAAFPSSSAPGFNPDDYTTEQAFFPSTDNTLVPMFITHKKGLSKDGQHPLLMYGYGGFNIQLPVIYHSSVTVFLKDLGGIYVSANIRGGGEYGDEWHKAGMKGKKQQVFDDFQAAAQYLIDEGYTNPDKLAIKGGSNGGLLVGACLNQRPDLFAAGISDGGVMDMLRFDTFTVGAGWTGEYGVPTQAEDFCWLKEYSPLHNVPENPKGGKYPATLLLVGGQDNRVPPLHSLKLIAKLQYTLGERSKTKGPLLLRFDPDVGHGFGKPTSKQIESVVEEYTFLFKTMNLRWHE